MSSTNIVWLKNNPFSLTNFNMMSWKTPNAVVKPEKWKRKPVREESGTDTQPWRVNCLPALLPLNQWLSISVTQLRKGRSAASLSTPQTPVLRRSPPSLWGRKGPRSPAHDTPTDCRLCHHGEAALLHDTVTHERVPTFTKCLERVCFQRLLLHMWGTVRMSRKLGI